MESRKFTAVLDSIIEEIPVEEQRFKREMDRVREKARFSAPEAAWQTQSDRVIASFVGFENRLCGRARPAWFDKVVSIWMNRKGSEE